MYLRVWALLATANNFLMSFFFPRNSLNIAGLHDLTSIEAAFYRGFFPVSFFFYFESFLISFDWLEKSLDRKPAPIDVIISMFT